MLPIGVILLSEDDVESTPVKSALTTIDLSLKKLNSMPFFPILFEI
jgi:hypothetical protein